MTSICILTNSDGETVKKMFSESLAKSWGLKIVFTGTHDECVSNWDDY